MIRNTILALSGLLAVCVGYVNLPAQSSATQAGSAFADTNGNGIDDAWELKYFGNLTTCTSSSSHNLDGILDRDEYALGFDPGKINLAVPRSPVIRGDYVDFVRARAAAFESGPDHTCWGPRHALGALAVLAVEKDPAYAALLAAGIKKTLHFYSDWVNASVAKDGGVFSEEGAPLCAFYFRALRRRGCMSAEDEIWARDLLLTLAKFQCAWNPGDGLWRGSQHRAQAQGVAQALAAALYPGEPSAPQWSAYAGKVWGDWWNFRDVGINDSGYFLSSLGTILYGAELMGRTEVFTDASSRQLFDRLVDEVTPDGAVIPYGSNSGYNSGAGVRILALELAARYTRDGRYRWVAQRLMNYLQARTLAGYQLPKELDFDAISLASLVCDDSVVPTEPTTGSAVLTRKEIIRIYGAQAKEKFPDAGGLDCDMYMTDRTMPSKLVLRSGWNPGDLYLLAECYVRHDPMNPTAIYGLERHSAGFAEMMSEKSVSRENAVEILDLSNTATFMGQKKFAGQKLLPWGWTGMESSVPVFSDHALATHASIMVTKYMGYEATQTREFLFVKNRFVLVRDDTVFDDSFRAAVGPVWNTQNVGGNRGANWLDTWFAVHSYQDVKRYTVPPWNLLIWYGNKAAATISVEDLPDNPQGQGPMKTARYVWTGDVSPGQHVQFVQVLLPHARGNDQAALAQGIEVLLDQPGVTAVTVNTLEGLEFALLNSEGQRVDLTSVTLGHVVTDARACYFKIIGGNVVSVLAEDATHVEFNGRVLHQSDVRTNYETPAVPPTDVRVVFTLN